MSRLQSLHGTVLNVIAASIDKFIESENMNSFQKKSILTNQKTHQVVLEIILPTLKWIVNVQKIRDIKCSALAFCTANSSGRHR